MVYRRMIAHRSICHKRQSCRGFSSRISTSRSKLSHGSLSHRNLSQFAGTTVLISGPQEEEGGMCQEPAPAQLLGEHFQEENRVLQSAGNRNRWYVGLCCTCSKEQKFFWIYPWPRAILW